MGEIGRETTMFRPIWGTALARSGGGLYAQCLSSHPEMMVAVSPNLQLCRSFRDAVVRHAPDFLRRAVPPGSPIQDWYGTADRIQGLDYFLHEASVDIPFDPAEWDSFLEASIARGMLDSADLAGHYHRLKGATYREMFANLLEIVADARQCRDRRWIGFHEPWTIDLYPALARAFPESRVLIVFRDPRAVVSSMLGVERIDPSQVAQVLSYVRHWRKYAAMTLQLLNMPFLRGRLHVTAHDLILVKPRPTIEAMCAAFDVAFDERMLDTNNYFDYATGAVWSGNSSFEQRTEGISAHRALRWRKSLPDVTLQAIEYLCAPELTLLGYPTFTPYADPGVDASADVTAFLMKDQAGYANWRSDLGDPLLDHGLEAVRRQLLRLKEPSRDAALVRRCFLFEETYLALHGGRAPLLPELADALAPQ